LTVELEVGRRDSLLPFNDEVFLQYCSEASSLLSSSVVKSIIKIDGSGAYRSIIMRKYFWFCVFVIVIMHQMVLFAEESSEYSPFMLKTRNFGRNLQNTTQIATNLFAICLAVRDDEDIVEWIEYHWRKGCSKFYVFDNFSNPPLKALVQSYIDRGIVIYSYTVQEMKPNPQIFIYQQCFSKFKSFHKFMGFIDVDEFIVTVDIKADIPSILSKYEHLGGLALSWMSFGSSGHIQRPNGSVISNYHRCGPNKHIKSIVNTEHTIGPSANTHAFKYHRNFTAQTTGGEVVPSAWAEKPVYDIIYINHYCTKSKQDFQRKKKRGGGAGRIATDAWFERINRDFNNSCAVLTMPDLRLDQS